MANKKILLILTLICSVSCDSKCSTSTCVQTSATILEKIDNSVEPCDCFYDFACGAFGENNYIDDEDDSISTLSIMNNNLQEILLKIVESESDEKYPKFLNISKKFYESCTDAAGENIMWWRFDLSLHL